MYEKLKKLAIFLLPVKLLERHEVFFRKLISHRYSGQKYSCNICDFGLRDFVVLSNGNKLCPNCGSLPRTRRLFSMIDSEYTFENKTVLHFSPSKAMSSKLRKLKAKEYVTTDFEGEFLADEKIDITQINKKDNSFDLIICYHVLEHIKADDSAISELYRVLRVGGKCLIQTPFKIGEIYEDDLIQTPEDRLIHFGQKDHVRIYSVEGLINKLNKAGFLVDQRDFNSILENRQGFEQNETVLVAQKE